MKFAKVQFASAEARVRALEVLLPQAKVTALRDNIYIVPAPALDALKLHQIPHTVLQQLHRTMSYRRYEVLLPTRYNDGLRVEAEKIDLTLQEIIHQFGAVTFHPEHLLGVWLHEGQHFEDYNVRLIVDVEDTEESAAFFSPVKGDSENTVSAGRDLDGILRNSAHISNQPALAETLGTYSYGFGAA